MYTAFTRPLLRQLLLAASLLAPAAALANSPANLVEQAEEQALAGDLDGALPLYEKAISQETQAAARHALHYRYGMLLNALGGAGRSELYPLARAQFQTVLHYLEEDGATLEHSPARVRSALAHTYHQQAGSEDSPARQAQLLRNAYGLYRAAAPELAQDGEWHNLAITYFNLGQVCEWQGNLIEAIDWVEKAVALDIEHGFEDLEEDRAYLLALRQLVNPPADLGATAL